MRIIAATHRDLDGDGQARGSFRDDLGFRLRVVQLELPPLRERLADLPHLVDHFVARGRRAARQAGRARSATEALDHPDEPIAWPGNVRELKNAVESMVLLSTRRR